MTARSPFPNYMYILIGRLPVPCDDVVKWGEWMNGADRRVAQTRVGCLNVSTVFLGLNHSFGGGDAPPDLFETMIFDGDDFRHIYMTRCATWDEAEKMHAAAVAHAEEKIKAVLTDGWIEKATEALHAAAPRKPSA